MNQATKTIQNTTATARTLPRPQLTEFENFTPLRSFRFMDMGAGRKFFDVVLVKASFDFGTGIAKFSKNQLSVCLADELWQDEHDNIQRESEYSSLKAVGDTVLFKPLTDVYVTGTVRSFQNKPQTSWNGILRVRQGKSVLISKILRFTGPRFWRHTGGNIWKLTPASATTHVPLRYELAYGGRHIDLKAKRGTEPPVEVFAPNPAGSGYFGPADSLFGAGNGSPVALHQRDEKYLGPQIDWPTDRISTNTDINFKTYLPAGWGPIARWWSPRVERQGSYDAAWQRDFDQNTYGYADYPKDFDCSYFNCAPADQMVKGALNGSLQGDEFIELAGVFSDKEAVSVQLQGWMVMARLVDHDGKFALDHMRLDTIHVDLDNQQLHATWRLALPHDRNIRFCALALVSQEDYKLEKK